MAEEQDPRDAALNEYKRVLLQHKEADSKVRALREDVKTVKKEYDKTEDDLKALQSVGQIIGEVLRQLDEERCESRFLMRWGPLPATMAPDQTGSDASLTATDLGTRCCDQMPCHF